MSRKCCVDGCTSTSKNSKLHHFPRDKFQQSRWLRNLLPYSKTLIANHIDFQTKYNVCKVHFEEKYIVNSRRILHGLPTLFTAEEICSGIPNSKLKFLENNDKDFSEKNKEERNYIVAHINKFHNYSTLGKKPKTGEHNYSLPPEKEQDEIYKKILFDVPQFALSQKKLINHVKSTKHLKNGNVMRSTLHVKGTQENIDTIKENTEVIFCDDAVDYIDQSETDPQETEKNPIGLFTWQKNAITCTDDAEDECKDEPIKCKEENTNEQIDMLLDSETVVECNEETQESRYRCNECDGEIVGSRYSCLHCVDYDVCLACEARGSHSHHYALRVPANRARDEVQRVIDAIWKCINDYPPLLGPTNEMIKIEIKDEDEELLAETELGSDPLMTPSALSPLAGDTCRRVPELHQALLHSPNATYAEHSALTEHTVLTEHTEHTTLTAHTQRTAQNNISQAIHDALFNQQFIFNTSSFPDDTGQEYNEMYFLIDDTQENFVLTYMSNAICDNSAVKNTNVDNTLITSDDINNPISIKASDQEYTIMLPTSSNDDTESHFKLRQTKSTKYITNEIIDLNFIQNKSFLVKIDDLDVNQADLRNLVQFHTTPQL